MLNSKKWTFSFSLITSCFIALGCQNAGANAFANRPYTCDAGIQSAHIQTHRVAVRDGLGSTEQQIQTRRTIPFESLETYTVATQNVLNLGVERRLVQAFEGSDRIYEFASDPKDIEKQKKAIDNLVNRIADHKPDFLALQEVFSDEAMNALIKQPRLRGRYVGYFIEGNDTRGINVCLLVRSDLNVQVEYISFKDFQWFPDKENRPDWYIPVQSRDSPVAVIFSQGVPVLAMMLLHHKSLGGPESGYPKREIQAETETLIWEERIYPPLGGQIPGITLGDFNNDVDRAREFRFFRSHGWVDVHTLLGLRHDHPDRATYKYFPKRGRPSLNELDGIMLNRTIQEYLVSAEVVRRPGGWPNSRKALHAFGTDHEKVKSILRNHVYDPKAKPVRKNEDW